MGSLSSVIIILIVLAMACGGSTLTPTTPGATATTSILTAAPVTTPPPAASGAASIPPTVASPTSSPTPSTGMGRDAQGKRLRKFVNVTGKKADADRRLRELLTADDRGLPILTDKMTLAQWLDKWFNEYVVSGKRQMTGERYKRVIERYLKPYLGHTQLNRLSPADIRALVTKWESEGVTPYSIDYSHGILSSALKYAVKMEVLFRNPAQIVDTPRVEKKEVQPPDITTVNNILASSHEKSDRLFPALRLIAYSGVRRGECLGLHWQHVDFARQDISIAFSLTRSFERGLILEPPKSKASRRVIDLDSGTMEVLRNHKVKQMEHRLSLGGAYEDSDRVFPNEFGQLPNPMVLTRASNHVTKRIEVHGVKPHDLRHFHASVLLQSGQNPVLVSKRLGHSTVSMTLDIYGHLMPGWQTEAANVFAKAMETG